MEANIGHLSTKFGYKQMQGWKVIQVFVSITDRRTDAIWIPYLPPPWWAQPKLRSYGESCLAKVQLLGNFHRNFTIFHSQ